MDSKPEHVSYIPKFEGYNGWKNKTTWAVYSHLTSYSAWQRQLERCKSVSDVERYVSWLFASFLRQGLRGEARSTIKLLFQDFAINANRGYVEWSKITNALHDWEWPPSMEVGHPLLIEHVGSSLFSQLLFLLFSQNKEQFTLAIEGAAHRLDEDYRLMDWFDTQADMWLTYPDMRIDTYPMHHIMLALISVYVESIDWEAIYKAVSEQ